MVTGKLCCEKLLQPLNPTNHFFRANVGMRGAGEPIAENGGVIRVASTLVYSTCQHRPGDGHNFWGVFFAFRVIGSTLSGGDFAPRTLLWRPHSTLKQDMFRLQQQLEIVVTALLWCQSIPTARSTYHTNPQQGQYGRGVKSIQQGHIVVVLFGGDCPFVLREDGVERGKHRTVGDGYMDGFIDGEGMTDEMAGRNLEFMIV
ncbi:hypothetical protein QC762_0104440 [Podospora pseudocomata]|uniref:Uncharacterized protein n=1 Tax=Podospora pseudocomata TaxID=2093779 RepID=A0ABR0G2F0_9PEZI|nr:hypothetical protein QC762_0104440 [Podospora pseudocomata]